MEKELKKLALVEIRALKKAIRHLTFELSFSSWEGDDVCKCLYGQAFGESRSKEAVVFLNTVAVPYSSHVKEFYPPTNIYFTKLHIGASALEFYENQLGAEVKKIFSYLNGKRKTLRLSDL
jgi:hypothetical protein